MKPSSPSLSWVMRIRAVLRASWKISFYIICVLYACAECCHPLRIKMLLACLQLAEGDGLMHDCGCIIKLVGLMP